MTLKLDLIKANYVSSNREQVAFKAVMKPLINLEAKHNGSGRFQLFNRQIENKRHLKPL